MRDSFGAFRTGKIETRTRTFLPCYQICIDGHHQVAPGALGTRNLPTYRRSSSAARRTSALRRLKSFRAMEGVDMLANRLKSFKAFALRCLLPPPASMPQPRKSGSPRQNLGLDHL
jgi:hypothetical protein